MGAKAAVNRWAILVGEDDPNDVLLLKRAFQKAGVPASLFFVSNGQEVISYLGGEAPFDDRAQYPFPNILLLDLNMPAVSGLEVMQWLVARPERANLIVVIFSSCVAPADRQQAAMLGAHSCFTKPLDPTVLFPMLSELSRNLEPGHVAVQENCPPQLRSSSRNLRDGAKCRSGVQAEKRTSYSSP